MSKRKMFKQDGDLDFQSWLTPRSQENNKDFRERIELGVRYEYTRHSPLAKNALASAELKDQTPADCEILNVLESKQGAWVWALRSLYPHLKLNRPFLAVPSRDIGTAIKLMRLSAGFGRTKLHGLPGQLSQIAPRPGHAISDRQVLMKWDRLYGKRRKSEAPELRERAVSKTRRLSDDDADRHIPGRQFAEDGSELWLFTLQLEACTVEEMAAWMACEIRRFAPSERPRITAAARSERKGNAIELVPLPPCIPEIDNGVGGYRSLVRIRWQEFNLEEIATAIEATVRCRRGDVRKLTGTRRHLDQVLSSADALVALRWNESVHPAADAICEYLNYRYAKETGGDMDEGNFRHKHVEAQKQFQEWFQDSGSGLMSVW